MTDDMIKAFEYHLVSGEDAMYWAIRRAVVLPEIFYYTATFANGWFSVRRKHLGHDDDLLGRPVDRR